MRKVMNMQGQIFCPSIDKITFDLKSRDEIPKLLIGLQAIYKNKKIRNEVFETLLEMIPKNVNPQNGRKGMDLWEIFVLGTLRLVCNIDFDKLRELANEHSSLRMMLGISEFDKHKKYALQTIRDNIVLFTPEILAKINVIVVNLGHKTIGHQAEAPLKGSCDSFVLETDVHFPTDINLLFDAIRKTIEKTGKLCDQLGLIGWREKKSIIKKIKKKMHTISKMKRSASKNKEKQAQRNELIKDSHEHYIDYANNYVERAQQLISTVNIQGDIMLLAKTTEIQSFIVHAKRQIEQIRRRVIDGETIAHHEKVFSIFEEHTEWISKGKAGVPVELGKRVCVVKDQYGFILHHRVMENETDDKVAVPMIFDTKNFYPNLKSCSFDKGFHSPANQKELADILDEVFLPRKGKLSAKTKKIEHAEKFIKARYKHAAVESSINALENHGLDICRDHGLVGFKRYVALAVVARNIQILGHTVQAKALKRKRRSKSNVPKTLPLAA